MKIEIDDNIYKEFKKVMKAKEIAYIHRNNELFFKAKLIFLITYLPYSFLIWS